MSSLPCWQVQSTFVRRLLEHEQLGFEVFFCSGNRELHGTHGDGWCWKGSNTPCFGDLWGAISLNNRIVMGEFRLVISIIHNRSSPFRYPSTTIWMFLPKIAGNPPNHPFQWHFPLKKHHPAIGIPPRLGNCPFLHLQVIHGFHWFPHVACCGPRKSARRLQRRVASKKSRGMPTSGAAMARHRLAPSTVY